MVLVVAVAIVRCRIVDNTSVVCGRGSYVVVAGLLLVWGTLVGVIRIVVLAISHG
jgi:predicted membrane protein